MSFSKSGYLALLAAFAERGYAIRSFFDAEPSKPHLILRHDVDISVAKAAELAELERSAGAKSIYFVLLRTELYNVMSASDLASLKAIQESGHEIGLHFDASLYDGDEQALENSVGHEAEILERIVGTKVRAISFHRPAKTLIGGRDQIAGRMNAYGERFTKDIGYCSDSQGNWRFGEPLEQPCVREHRALQLLTHPFWWTGGEEEPADRLDRFIAARQQFMDEELARQCAVHKPGRRGRPN